MNADYSNFTKFYSYVQYYTEGNIFSPTETDLSEQKEENKWRNLNEGASMFESTHKLESRLMNRQTTGEANA